MSNTYNIQSAERILTIIDALSKKGPAGATELARITGLDKATVYRFVTTLVNTKFAKKDAATNKYYLTFKLVKIAERIKEKLDMTALVRPHIDRLSETTGETVHFVERESADIVYIDKVESYKNTFRMVSRIGLRQSAFATAVGKAMLAALPDSEIAALWEAAEITALTENTITEKDNFLADIHKIRECGFALDNQENELGVTCIAVSLSDYTGKPSNAISISAPTSRMTAERISELSSLLLLTKSDISAEI